MCVVHVYSVVSVYVALWGVCEDPWVVLSLCEVYWMWVIDGQYPLGQVFVRYIISESYHTWGGSFL